MEQEKINRLQWILDDAVARGEIPGAILMVRKEGKETVYLESFGKPLGFLFRRIRASEALALLHRRTAIITLIRYMLSSFLLYSFYQNITSQKLTNRK